MAKHGRNQSTQPVYSHAERKKDQGQACARQPCLCLLFLRRNPSCLAFECISAAVLRSKRARAVDGASSLAVCNQRCLNAPPTCRALSSSTTAFFTSACVCDHILATVGGGYGTNKRRGGTEAVQVHTVLRVQGHCQLCMHASIVRSFMSVGVVDEVKWPSVKHSMFMPCCGAGPQAFDCCHLSSQAAKTPVITPDGYLFDKQNILENLLSQRKDSELHLKRWRVRTSCQGGKGKSQKWRAPASGDAVWLLSGTCSRPTAVVGVGGLKHAHRPPLGS